MDQRTKLLLALQQLENIVNLTKENEYERYIYSKLITVKYELERQLTNLQHHGTSS